MNHPTATDWRNRAEAAEQRCAELADDVCIWKTEAEDRSQGMIDLNLDRAAMGVENLKLRDRVIALESKNAGLRARLEIMDGDPEAILAKRNHTITMLERHIWEISKALNHCAYWFRYATANDDCEWLNEHGWPLAETHMKEADAALANYTAWLIDGGAK